MRVLIVASLVASAAGWGSVDPCAYMSGSSYSECAYSCIPSCAFPDLASYTPAECYSAYGAAACGGCVSMCHSACVCPSGYVEQGNACILASECPGYSSTLSPPPAAATATTSPPPPEYDDADAACDGVSASKVKKCSKHVSKDQYKKCKKKCSLSCCLSLATFPPPSPPAPSYADVKSTKWCSKKLSKCSKKKIQKKYGLRPSRGPSWIPHASVCLPFFGRCKSTCGAC